MNGWLYAVSPAEFAERLRQMAVERIGNLADGPSP
jgi:hypothetical protein